MAEDETKTPLRAERDRRQWTQAEVAEAIGVSTDTLSRWERGKQMPEVVHQRDLGKHFGIDMDHSWFRKQQDETTPPKILWNIPFLHNPYFTMNEQVLSDIKERLEGTQENIHMLCLCGLGGIGKTQMVLEYAHRYSNDLYQAVFWVNAETQAQFVSDLVKIAKELRVPEAKKKQPNQRYLVNEFKQWLKTHSNWLLILDNVEEEVKIKNLLIAAGQKGHILLTTRQRAVADLAQNTLDVAVMAPEIGALFLLRRAHLLELTDPFETVSARDQGHALTLAQLLGGLPLAMEQAGAYIHETRCGLAGYIQEYQVARAELLSWYSTRKKLSIDYGETVATTWKISFEQVNQQSPAASELLQLCAFLYPDTIPEDIVRKGGQAAGGELSHLSEDPLEFDDACAVLLNYSLIHRNVTGNQLAIHRLVQAVLQDRLDEEEQKKWAEKTVMSVERALSTALSEEIEQYLPHARQCANLIKRWDLQGEEVAYLLEQAADAIHSRGWYAQATPLYLRTLGALQKLPGSDHSRVMKCLMDIARVHMERGMYDFAAVIYETAYKQYEATFGLEHPLVMRCLVHLVQALLKGDQAQKAIDLGTVVSHWYRELQEPESVELAMTYQITAEISALVGRNDLAEADYLSALQIYKRVLGSEHPEVAKSLINLGIFYLSHDNLVQAEVSFQQALNIQQQSLGMDHPDRAKGLDGLAELFYRRKAYARSEELGKQALHIRRQKLGPYHPEIVQNLHGIASSLAVQRKDKEAEQTFKEAQAIAKEAGGEESLQNLQVLMSYANFLQVRGRDEEAERYIQQFTVLKKHIERGGRLASFDLSDDDDESSLKQAHVWTLNAPHEVRELS